ncbi:MAG: hypothetical protein BalsKO_07190 [Balneolaceae bacterium]
MPKSFGALYDSKKINGPKLLQQARDEAHRFAITFHRQKRAKRTFVTELTEIEGVGTKTSQKLLKELGSVKEVKKATKEELVELTGEKIGETIFNYFRG